MPMISQSTIISQKEKISCLYIVKSGEITLFQNSTKICYLKPYQTFGEESVIEPCESLATYICSQNGSLIEFRVSEFFLSTFYVPKFKEFIRDCVKESFDVKTRIRKNGEVVFLTKEKDSWDFRRLRGEAN